MSTKAECYFHEVNVIDGDRFKKLMHEKKYERSI